MMYGPHVKPSIRHMIVRTGYRGDIRMICMFLTAFGYRAACSSLQDACEVLAGVYQSEARRYESNQTTS